MLSLVLGFVAGSAGMRMYCVDLLRDNGVDAVKLQLRSISSKEGLPFALVSHRIRCVAIRRHPACIPRFYMADRPYKRGEDNFPLRPRGTVGCGLLPNKAQPCCILRSSRTKPAYVSRASIYRVLTCRKNAGRRGGAGMPVIGHIYYP